MTARDVPEEDGQLSNLKVTGHSMFIIRESLTSCVSVCVSLTLHVFVCSSQMEARALLRHAYTVESTSV